MDWYAILILAAVILVIEAITLPCLLLIQSRTAIYVFGFTIVGLLLLFGVSASVVLHLLETTMSGHHHF